MTSMHRSFTPTETWPSHPTYADLAEPIQRAMASMNRKSPSQLISALQASLERSRDGISFAVLKGEAPGDYSATEALVVLNPFANVATPLTLVGADFIREVARSSDIRDARGKLKPVVMLASPGLGTGSSIGLSRAERRDLARGELGPIASKLLAAVYAKGFRRVALLGFSQGADIALAGARRGFAANLDVYAAAAIDPAGTEKRSVLRLASDFLKSGNQELKEAIAATGVTAQRYAFGSGLMGLMRFGLSAATPANLALCKGLGANTLEHRIQTIRDEGLVKRLVVGYGARSAIARPEQVEPALRRLYEQNGSDSFISIRVEGADHSWVGQLTLLAELYMRAVA